MNKIVKTTPYSQIPNWLHGEITDLVDLTATLINKVNGKNGPDLDGSYDKQMWNNMISIINRLSMTGIIHIQERNELMQNFQDIATGKDGVNYPFYLLRILYYNGYFNSDENLFIGVREALIHLAKCTEVGEILQIDTYAEIHFGGKSYSKSGITTFNYTPHILGYTSELIKIIKNENTIEESEYIQSFSDFLFAEDILDLKQHEYILIVDTSHEMAHAMLLELLLLDYYEENEKIMIEVAQVLITYYEGAKQEEYILNYISQYTDDMINIK